MNPNPQPTKAKKKKVKNFQIDLGKPLGKGQQGEVFQAYREDTKEPVAVKISKKQTIQKDKKSKDALFYEIQIMQNVKSPNIIEFYDVAETENNIYIFQELANQGTLTDMTLIKEFRRFTEKEVIDCLAQLLNGFIELQRHGIMHRDIKPTNILVKDNVFKIADFGLSRYWGSVYSVKTITGTPLYMAPQIITSIIDKKQPCVYTEKCDLWSLGVVAFQLLTGKFPWVIDFKQKSSANILQSIRDQSTVGVSFPSHIPISDNLKNFIQGCLKYEEQDRLNWSDAFQHPIFQGRFKGLALNLENYIITDLRQKIHSHNISVEKFLAQFGQKDEKLDKQDLFCFFIALIPTITEKQSQNLYKVMAQGKTKVTKAKILDFLDSHQIVIKGLVGKKLPKKEQKQAQSQKKREGIEKRLAGGVAQNYLDLFKIYKKYSTQDKISREQFNFILSTIIPDTNKDQISIFFDHFNSQNTPSLNFITFYEDLCQIAKLPAITDERIYNQLKNLQHKS